MSGSYQVGESINASIVGCKIDNSIVIFGSPAPAGTVAQRVSGDKEWKEADLEVKHWDAMGTALKQYMKELGEVCTKSTEENEPTQETHQKVRSNAIKNFKETLGSQFNQSLGKICLDTLQQEADQAYRAIVSEKEYTRIQLLDKAFKQALSKYDEEMKSAFTRGGPDMKTLDEKASRMATRAFQDVLEAYKGNKTEPEKMLKTKLADRFDEFQAEKKKAQWNSLLTATDKYVEGMRRRTKDVTIPTPQKFQTIHEEEKRKAIQHFEGKTERSISEEFLKMLNEKIEIRRRQFFAANRRANAEQRVNDAPPEVGFASGESGRQRRISSDGELSNFKGKLSELCKRNKWKDPVYEQIGSGPPFLMKVTVNDVTYEGAISAPQKRQAESLAAGACLKALGAI